MFVGPSSRIAVSDTAKNCCYSISQPPLLPRLACWLDRKIIIYHRPLPTTSSFSPTSAPSAKDGLWSCPQEHKPPSVSLTVTLTAASWLVRLSEDLGEEKRVEQAHELK